MLNLVIIKINWPYKENGIGTSSFFVTKNIKYLEEYKIKALIKKYSDFIRYPIKMDLTERKLKEGSENEYEDVIESFGE